MTASISVDRISTAPTRFPSDKEDRERVLRRVRTLSGTNTVYGAVHSAMIDRRKDVELLAVFVHTRKQKRVGQLAINATLEELNTDFSAPAAAEMKKYAKLTQIALNAESAQRVLTRHGGDQLGLINVFRSEGETSKDRDIKKICDQLLDEENFYSDSLTKYEEEYLIDKLNSVLPFNTNWRDETRILSASPERVEEMAKEKLAIEERLYELGAMEDDPLKYLDAAYELLSKSPRMLLSVSGKVMDEFAKRVQKIRLGFNPSSGSWGVELEPREPMKPANDNQKEV